MSYPILCTSEHDKLKNILLRRQTSNLSDFDQNLKMTKTS